MGLKIAVIGGGSTYTPELVQGLVDRTDTLPVDELVLHDIDGERLAVVSGLPERILRRQGWPGRLVSTTDRAEAIDGASFVLVQLRVGGQQTRYSDETLPHRFGCIGQETTGPGGFAKALRTVPVVLELAEDVGRRSAPDAWIVDFTNPVGIVTQALARCRSPGDRPVQRGDRVPAPARRPVRRGARADRARARRTQPPDLDPGGPGRRSRPPAGDAGRGRRGDCGRRGHPVDLLRALGAIPSYYLHYYYSTRQVLEQQLAGGTRAQDVMAIERELLEMYRDPTLDRKPALLEQRGGAFYSEAAAQLITSLHAGTGDVQVVDVRNDGALPDLPDHAVVEVPARIDRDGAHPLPQAPLAPEIRGLVQRAKAYEELAVIAATTGDRRAALLALLANPLVPDMQAAEGLLAAILETNAAVLPRFAASV